MGANTMVRLAFLGTVIPFTLSSGEMGAPQALRGVEHEAENGMRSSRFLQEDYSGSTCSDGTPGIEASGACCVWECGGCGGAGCSSFGEDIHDARHCCTSDILASGLSCAETGEAPCVVGGEEETPPTPVTDTSPTPVTPDTPAPVGGPAEVPDEGPDEGSTCSNGLTGIERGGICCDAACGTCGGSGCSSAGGSTLGAMDCCTSDIAEFGDSCDEKGSAPCIIEVADDGVPDTSGDRGGDSGGGSSSTTTTTTTGGVPEGPDGLFDTYTWVECFQIKDPEPFFLITESRDMTPQLCFETCVGEGATFMGTYQGARCACGNDFSLIPTTPDGYDCGDSRCFGDVTESCGGSGSYDLYEFVEAERRGLFEIQQ